MSRFQNISAGGRRLEEGDTSAVAVLDSNSGLMWSAIESVRVTWTRAVELMARVASTDAPERMAALQELFGDRGAELVALDGWRLPTVEELFMLADRSLHSPAINTAFFPGCKRDWYWTSTPAAYSPSDYAWCVYFDLGNANWFDQDYNGFVRAVRAGQ